MRKYRFCLNLDVLEKKVKKDQKLGKTLRVCAELSGLSYDTVICWVDKRKAAERDPAFTSLESAEAFSKVVGIPREELFTEMKIS